MRLTELHSRFHDKVQFLSVYIREAHPTDGWWLGGGLPGKAVKVYANKVSTDVKDPTTTAERQTAAGRCAAAVHKDMPTLVDGIDDTVNKAYAAWPTRLYLIDTDGRVAYAGGLGPFGFSPAALGKAIDKLLTRQYTPKP